MTDMTVIIGRTDCVTTVTTMTDTVTTDTVTTDTRITDTSAANDPIVAKTTQDMEARPSDNMISLAILTTVHTVDICRRPSPKPYLSYRVWFPVLLHIPRLLLIVVHLFFIALLLFRFLLLCARRRLRVPLCTRLRFLLRHRQSHGHRCLRRTSSPALQPFFR
jgi:hypothetical protein